MKAELTNIKRGILGTAVFDMKVEKIMRKSQGFVVYPLGSDADGKEIRIQSSHRYGILNLTTGECVISAHYAQYATAQRLVSDCAAGRSVRFKLSDFDLHSLRMVVFSTAGELVGCSVMKTENAGALHVLNHEVTQ